MGCIKFRRHDSLQRVQGVGDSRPALARLKRLLNRRTERIFEFRPQFILMVNGLGQGPPCRDAVIT